MTPIRRLGKIPAVNNSTADCSAEMAYRIIAIDGGMTTAIAPEEAIRPTEKRSL